MLYCKIPDGHQVDIFFRRRLIKFLMYTSLVRPQLEYACQHGIPTRGTTSLNWWRQRRAARCLCGQWLWISHRWIGHRNGRFSSVRLLIEKRCRNASLVNMYQTTNHYIATPDNLLTKSDSRTKGNYNVHPSTPVKTFINTHTFPRTIRGWTKSNKSNKSLSPLQRHLSHLSVLSTTQFPLYNCVPTEFLNACTKYWPACVFNPVP